MARVLKVDAAAVEGYLAHLKADYAKWNSGAKDERHQKIRDEMVKEFNENLHYEVGNKYIKVIKGGHNTSVHSFIVNTDKDKKFKLGDVLKAAGWNAPARNHARGNVIEGNYRASWAGAHYM